MDDKTDVAPLYYIEINDEPPKNWRVIGPNGLVGAYESESDAQARADLLNEQVAEETEDDS